MISHITGCIAGEVAFVSDFVGQRQFHRPPGQSDIVAALGSRARRAFGVDPVPRALEGVGGQWNSRSDGEGPARVHADVVPLHIECRRRERQCAPEVLRAVGGEHGARAVTIGGQPQPGPVVTPAAQHQQPGAARGHRGGNAGLRPAEHRTEMNLVARLRAGQGRSPGHCPPQRGGQVDRTRQRRGDVLSRAVTDDRLPPQSTGRPQPSQHILVQQGLGYLGDVGSGSRGLRLLPGLGDNGVGGEGAEELRDAVGRRISQYQAAAARADVGPAGQQRRGRLCPQIGRQRRTQFRYRGGDHRQPPNMLGTSESGGVADIFDGDVRVTVDMVEISPGQLPQCLIGPCG